MQIMLVCKEQTVMYKLYIIKKKYYPTIYAKNSVT